VSTLLLCPPVELDGGHGHSAPCDAACDGTWRLGLTIHLLGPPRVERDGQPVDPPRGHKPWGLLAYLLRSHAPSSRERIASLLFPEADDPLGSLRWALSTLRRQLGETASIAGDPPRLGLPPGTFLDVEVLDRGSWVEAVALPGLGHELLDGVTFRGSPGFEIWLEAERRHVAGTTASVLHEAALALLGRGEPEAALRHAFELVRLNSFDENAHTLLVRCLVASGDADAAAQQVEACVELFERELGVTPSPALHVAALNPVSSRRTAVPSRAAVRAQIETGEAVLAAGALEAGLERLRGAVASAEASNDDELRVRSLIALGGALVHTARGNDEEGAAALHKGSALAETNGLRGLAATGWREIAWVQFLRAEYVRAEETLARSAVFAEDDQEELAWMDVILGACRNDVGDYEAAGALLRSAVERSTTITRAQPAAFARTMLGRYHLQRGELDQATTVLDEALWEVDARGLIAFRPWPLSFRAEIDLVLGDIDSAEERFEHAFALGRQVGDPCWEGIAARGLGLVAASRGDIERAFDFLVDAPRLCRRLPDTYLWIEAYSLDALCEFAIEHRATAMMQWIDQLEAMAARRGMRELLLRAAIYRARVGEPGALDAAGLLAEQIDNPATEKLIASVEYRAVG
jgi:DNA-binding SARP family transcriptional activator